MNARTFQIIAIGLVGLAVIVWWADRQPVQVGHIRNQGRAIVSEFRSGPSQEHLSHPLSLFRASLAEAAPGEAKVRRSVYVPAYSAIRIGSGRGRINLATTLSIHNTSRDRPLLLERVDYHNTEGQLVRAYLEKPVALKPLSTIEIFVAEEDLQGGTGANFVVDWAADGPISEPAVEAVMIGTLGTTSYSFVSPGRMTRLVAPE